MTVKPWPVIDSDGHVLFNVAEGDWVDVGDRHGLLRRHDSGCGFEGFQDRFKISRYCPVFVLYLKNSGILQLCGGAVGQDGCHCPSLFEKPLKHVEHRIPSSFAGLDELVFGELHRFLFILECFAGYSAVIEMGN